MESLTELNEKLQAVQQQHVLRYWDQLDQPSRERLQNQLTDIDFDQLAMLVEGQDEHQDFAAMAEAASSPPGVRADGSGVEWSSQDAVKRGEEALRAGQIGAIIVAGGQGTRLGFDKPKGMFPIGPVSGRTLFQFFADRLIATQQRYGVRIPLYVMTSEATDAETRDYFAANDYLGLSPEDVRIFQQGTMPAVDAATGKLLLASKDSLALSPDGHGGTVRALQRSGCLEDARQRGVEHLAYIQVDNPLANLCDPELLGHHLLSGSEMTSQVVRKRYATEKVGNVVLVDGQTRIIEYSDLPLSAAEATGPDGELRLWAGSIAVHVIDVAFLQRMSQTPDALPFHRALKAVPHLDDSGQLVEPDDPNATKFERFIFDLLPKAHNAIVVESEPSRSFAPVKNAEGASTDTASLAKKAVSDLHRDWLKSAGAVVKEGIQVEINPCYALTAEELKEKISPNFRIDSDQYLPR